MPTSSVNTGSTQVTTVRRVELVRSRSPGQYSTCGGCLSETAICNVSQEHIKFMSILSSLCIQIFLSHKIYTLKYVFALKETLNINSAESI